MKKLPWLAILLLGLMLAGSVYAQDTATIITKAMFTENQLIFLSQLDGWKFKAGNNSEWADPQISTDDWETLKPADLTFEHADKNGKIEGWFRFKFKLDSTFKDLPTGWRIGAWSALDIYLDGELVQSYGNADSNPDHYQGYNPNYKIPDPTNLNPGTEYELAVYFLDLDSHLIDRYTLREVRLDPWIRISGSQYTEYIRSLSKNTDIYNAIWLSALSLLTLLFWLLVYQNLEEIILKLIALLTTFMVTSAFANTLTLNASQIQSLFFNLVFTLSIALSLGLIPIIIARIFKPTIPAKLFYLLGFLIFAGLAYWFTASDIISFVMVVAAVITSIYYVHKFWKELEGAHWAVVAGLFLTMLWMLMYTVLTIQNIVVQEAIIINTSNIIVTGIYLTLPISLMIYVAIRFKEILLTTRKNADEIVQLSREKLKAEQDRQKLIESQKEELEKEVAKRTADLEKSLKDLKAAQTQLVKQEKLASLGQLTAGIAHEIKNPLNFVNNFSDLSVELVEEAREELSAFRRQMSGDREQVSEISDLLDDIEANLKKINEHGSRADGIVKSMLQHSRGGDGEMEPTDLNALIEEYLNLSFHGMRAGKNPINVEIKTELDESVGKIPLIAEDFSRVIINLCNNAFDAMREKANGKGETADDYLPKLLVRTQKNNDQIFIEIEDNGPGIPEEMKNKILQPFFTTKLGKEGTGLGLSITNDIIKAHGGEIQIESQKNKFTCFKIILNSK